MSLVTFKTKVKESLQLIPQYDGLSCQAACLGMLVGDRDIRGIRQELLTRGTAGDPYVMGSWVRDKGYGSRYKFYDNASLMDARELLQEGCSLITHGWFTGSGHVIFIDGYTIDTNTLSYKFHVQDPWAEFMAKSWQYDFSKKGYDGYYSNFLIYAACVMGSSVSSAFSIYRRGELNSTRKNMWLHALKPA